ncbi:MAG: DUF3576 domain-containing protein [Alphaproteobacteria bacterium]|nr:DUF3576 domain-containing protein [Alphaproteobacteria bacterium]
MKARSHILSFIALGIVSVFLAGCGSDSIKSEAKYPTGADRGGQEDIYKEPDSIFGGKGLRLLGGDDKKKDEQSGETGIGVNSFLWRASLDTVSFMPLASADPFGGVILTDWYSPPENTDERFKLNVFILDRQLRSDGVQVKLFRQIRKSGEWRDAAASPATARQLEDTILTRARQMRVAQMGRIAE